MAAAAAPKLTSSKETGAAVGGGAGYSLAEIIVWLIQTYIGQVPDNIEAALMVVLIAAFGYAAAWWVDENQPVPAPEVSDDQS